MNWKNIFKISTASLAFLAITSCSQESPWSDYTGEGGIKLNLTSSSAVLSEIPETKSVNTDIVAPSAELFQIRLTKNDGSFSKTWGSLKDFAEESSFSAGTYTLEAFYGSEDSQGIVADSEEGHEHAYYYGVENNIVVRGGESTNVQIHASLANSVVAIEYTDAFKNYFNSWNTTLQTKGEKDLSLGENEGLAYVIPGDVDVIIKAEQQNGKSLTLNPAIFEAAPRHLYKIRYNIYNGEIGKNDRLEITFNDDPEETHKIVVELTDELFASDGPEVTPDGFLSGDIIETLSGSNFENTLRFRIVARGGISEARLTIGSDSYKPSFLSDGVVDLVSATQEQLAAISEAGIKVSGIEGNSSELAIIDFSELCRNLPVGKHEISLVVKDRLQRANEPVGLTLSALSANMQIVEVKPSFLGSGYGELVISYNGADPTIPGQNPFTFEAKGNSSFEGVRIISINDIPFTKGFESKDYIYKIALPDVDKDEIPVRVFFNGASNAFDEKPVVIKYPEYTVISDSFSKRIILKIDGFEDDSKLNLYFDRLKVLIDGNITTNVVKDIRNGLITVTGLEPGKEYDVKTSLAATPSVGKYGSQETIRTESGSDVPNGDFSAVHNTINLTGINNGGTYGTTSLVKQQNKTSIVRDEANGWASLNSFTCYNGSKNRNSWYMVPSTFVENGVAVIRSVGYNHSGADLPQSIKTATYYSQNAPSDDQLNKISGEMFLGEYNYDGSDNRHEGVSFDCRPDKLQFDYTYAPYGDEEGYISIKIKDASGNVLSSGSMKLGLQSSWTTATLDLKGYGFGSRTASLEIGFRSTTEGVIPGIKILSGSDLKDYNGVWPSATVDTNQSKAFAMGSELRIDNVRFIYE